jgi:hypothetical protein
MKVVEVFALLRLKQEERVEIEIHSWIRANLVAFIVQLRCNIRNVIDLLIIPVSWLN